VRRLPRTTVLALGAAVLALTAASLLLVGRDDDARPSPPVGARTLAELQPDRIIRRVEEIRGLKLKRRPRFRLVPHRSLDAVLKRQERREGTAESKREERVGTALLKLLGLLKPDADLDRISRLVSEEGILGVYDGARNEMLIVRRDGDRLPVNAEATIAHELTHALDDQHYGIFRRLTRLARRSTGEDGTLAYQAVLEGSAEAVANEYARRYHVAQEAPGEQRSAERIQREVPFGALLTLSFPYAFGPTFVGGLGAPRATAALARAMTDRPPTSTVQVLDPQLYRDRTPIAPVRLRVGRVLGDDWVPLQPEDSLGAIDLLSLLALAEDDAASASLLSAGWRGGRYAYLRRRSSDGAGCAAPCTSRDAFVGTVRLLSDGVARRVAVTFGEVLQRRRRARRVGRGTWRVAGGAAAVRRHGDRVTIVYAPTPQLAARLARDGG